MELVRRVGLSPNVRKKQIPPKGQIFGVPLGNIVERCKNEHGIPDIVYQCVNYIRSYGLKEEGLFRISGNRRLIDQLHAEYDQYGTADLSNTPEISVVTSVFKMYFRELPYPLISDDVSRDILLITEERKLSSVELVDRLRRCCKALPKHNFTLIKYLCAFLNEVGQNVHHTKMTDSSLAIVFGPNLFKIKDDIEALQRQPAITRATGAMITYHDQIFSEKDGIYGKVNKSTNNTNNYIHVGAATVNPTTTPCFILPQNNSNNGKLISNNKENVILNNNKLTNNKTKDWDDTWLSALAHDSPSPETEDILARSHDSLSSMSPLTGSGNISIQLSLQQTIKECIWDMMIPTPTTSEHSFSTNYHSSNSTAVNRVSNTCAADNANMRRKGPRPDYHANRNSCIAVDNLRSNNHSQVILKPNHEFDQSPSPSPPFNRRSSDGMFNFEYLDNVKAEPLASVTKGRASPQKRKSQVSRSSKQPTSSSLPDTDNSLVPKLNLAKLNQVESNSSVQSVTTCPTETGTQKVSPTQNISSLTNKITLLKQHVQTFDKNFEKSHGRLPLGNERRPISAVVKELNELKRLLVDAKAVESSKTKSSLHNQFSAISDKIEEKRKLGGRPNDISLMTHSQLIDEKLCIQKLLLYFEETYGRPKTKDQKDTMRPIYDRYRKVKVALNKNKSESGPSDGDKTPTRQMGDTWNITLGASQGSASSGMELINLTPEQLNDKLAELQDVKKSLRKTLRDFEKSFLQSYGRKVLKDDRGPREAEYNEYKRVKAQIRLIETLLKRKDGSATI